MGDKKQRELKFSLEEKLEDIEIATVDCLICKEPIDVSLQPHGWLHLACESVHNPELFPEEELVDEQP
jgi:hypothetical protein